jgi:enoyl-CoA hydratase
VNRVLADADAVRSEAFDVARAIAENPPLAVQGAKAVLNEAQRYETDRGLEYVASWNAAHLINQDLGVAVAAFVSKEKPEYSGR